MGRRERFEQVVPLLLPADRLFIERILRGAQWKAKSLVFAELVLTGVFEKYLTDDLEIEVTLSVKDTGFRLPEGYDVQVADPT